MTDYTEIEDTFYICIRSPHKPPNFRIVTVQQYLQINVEYTLICNNRQNICRYVFINEMIYGM